MGIEFLELFHSFYPMVAGQFESIIQAVCNRDHGKSGPEL